ncbi:MAG: hypothetical protein AB1445_09340 [Bacillota bacterium]
MAVVIIGVRPGRSLGLLLVVLLVIFFGLLRPQFSVEYRRELVLSGPWGDGPGAFGRAKARDGGLWGPRFFDVSAHSIVVADSVNHRLQVFDLQGKLTHTIPLEMPGGARFFAGDVVFYRGQVAACDVQNGLILQWDGSKWEVLARLQPPPGTATVIQEGLAVDRTGYLYYAASFVGDLESAWQLWRRGPGSTPELVTAFRSQAGNPDVATGIARLVPELSGLVLGFAVSPGGQLYLHVAGTGGAASVLLAFDLASGRNLSVTELPKTPAVVSQLVGVDGYSRSYLAQIQEGQLSSVVVYGTRGDPMGLVRPPAGTGRGLVSVRIDERGRIYVLTQDEEGVTLDRHSPQRVLEVVPRWKKPQAWVPRDTDGEGVCAKL